MLQTGAPQPGPKLTTVILVRIKRSGGRKWMIPAAGPADGDVDAPKHEAPILTGLSRAFHWQRLLDEGRAASRTRTGSVSACSGVAANSCT